MSPFLSLLLRKLSLSYPEQNEETIELIHKQFTKKPNSFNTMIQDSIGSRFIESFLFASTDEILEHYLENNLIPNIVQYSKHIYANYSIQTLVKHRMHSDSQVFQLFLIRNILSLLQLSL